MSFMDIPELTPEERIEGLLKTIENYKELMDKNNHRFERDKTDIINQWMAKVQSKDAKISSLESEIKKWRSEALEQARKVDKLQDENHSLELQIERMKDAEKARYDATEPNKAAWNPIIKP